MASSRSPSRGRSRSRSHTPTSVKRAPSPGPARSQSPRRSPSPRSRSPSRLRAQRESRTPQARESRNGYGKKGGHGRSMSRSRSPSRGPRRPYRERSYTRSLSRGRNPQSSKIVVEKLTKNVTEGHLREIFGPYGRIESIDLPMNKQFNTNRGTAYILYDHPSGSESAIAAMHEGQVDGAAIAHGQAVDHLRTGTAPHEEWVQDATEALREEAVLVDHGASPISTTPPDLGTHDRPAHRVAEDDLTHTHALALDLRRGDVALQPEIRPQGVDDLPPTAATVVIVEVGAEAEVVRRRGQDMGEGDSGMEGRTL